MVTCSVQSSEELLGEWSKAIADVSDLTDQLHFLLRCANHTNQRAVARALAQMLQASQPAALEITIIGKPEAGAARIAQQLQASLNPSESNPASLKVRSTILEAADYADFTDEAVRNARDSDAILFIVSALAPLFDETVDFVKREFSSNNDKVFLVITADEEYPGFSIDTARELNEAIPQNPGLQAITIRSAAEIASALADMLSKSHVPAILQELREKVNSSCEQLLPVVNAFVELLSISQSQYLRRIDFIHRDLNALKTLAQQAQELLETHHTNLSGVTAVLWGLSQNMRRNAATAVQNAVIPKDSVTSQEARTHLGRRIVGTARAAGYSEFEARVQSLAMDLNSARSVLLSSMDQLRAEARAHLEELTLNLGAELFAAWLQTALHSSTDSPLDISLEPSTNFPDMVKNAAAQTRQAIPETEFSSGWTSRIEAKFKSEMVEAASSGWTSATIDQRLADFTAQTWGTTTKQPCGIMIGRLNEIVRVVSTELQSSRLGSLKLPGQDQNRTRVADAYRAFATKLWEMRQDYDLQGDT